MIGIVDICFHNLGFIRLHFIREQDMRNNIDIYNSAYYYTDEITPVECGNTITLSGYFTASGIMAGKHREVKLSRESQILTSFEC